jgi:hypothetical protein
MNGSLTTRAGLATNDREAAQFKRICSRQELLKKYGIMKQHMQSPDAVFFHRFLLPIYAPERSGIAGDMRDGYYANAMIQPTNMTTSTKQSSTTSPMVAMRI